MSGRNNPPHLDEVTQTLAQVEDQFPVPWWFFRGRVMPPYKGEIRGKIDVIGQGGLKFFS